MSQSCFFINHKKIKNRESLPMRIASTQTLQQEAPLFTRGSLTVEAAVVLPLVAAFLVTMLFLFQMLRVQRSVQEALVETGRVVAVQASLDSELVNVVGTELLFRKSIQKNEEIGRYVRNGSTGISLLGSRLSGDCVELTATYFMEPPVKLFHLTPIPVVQKTTSRKWTGREGLLEAGEKWVYVSNNRQVYHNSKKCRTLNVSISETTLTAVERLRSHNGGRFKPCPFCGKKQKRQERVYITDQGDFYHYRVDCLSLRRSIRLVRRSEVENLPPCYYCGGESVEY